MDDSQDTTLPSASGEPSRASSRSCDDKVTYQETAETCVLVHVGPVEAASPARRGRARAHLRPGMATSVAASASTNLALGSVPTRSCRRRRRRRGAASLVPGGTRDDDARHRHRRWRVAPDVDGAASPGADLSIERPRPNAPSDALERLLATRFATLGEAIRAPPSDREDIERCVKSLERANPTRAPATSPAQTGDWTLRYTTSVGTMASVATWETVAGAVTDVSQRVDADAERPAVWMFATSSSSSCGRGRTSRDRRRCRCRCRR